MLIKTVTLQNFRSYKNKVSIDFEKLTAFIGPNDIGKSTIMEALDIFFNDGSGVIKMDKGDLNVQASEEGGSDIVIAVEFDDLPPTIIIDDSNKTTLKSEYLLNSQGKLTIVKRYPNGGKPKIFIMANHPSNPECSNLLSLKSLQLKTRIKELGIDCDKTKNAVMRKAIWNHFKHNLQLKEQEIEIKADDLKDIYSKLSQYFPLYSLFQADRKNSDKDKEAQDPIQEAVKLILSNNEIQKECNYIANKVTEELKLVTDATLAKLSEMNKEVADDLQANIPSSEELKWTDVFKSVTLSGKNGIPINKRGSGVKRLVLLNFFRAEAEKQRDERNHPSVIYAIEEPETSQHIRYQKLLIDSLKTLSNKPNVQIVLTTHSSYMVKQLDFKNIRLIKEENSSKSVSHVEPNCLTYPSLNEINYVAFGDASIEYHIELFSYLQAKAIVEHSSNSVLNKFDKWLNNKGVQLSKQYTRMNKDGSKGTMKQCTLPYYVRNQIDHPENHYNKIYTQRELTESIIEMRKVVLKNYHSN